MFCQVDWIHTFFIFVLFAQNRTSSNLQSDGCKRKCSPALEGQNFTLNFKVTLQSKSTKVVVKLSNKTISSCSCEKCSSFLDKFYNVNFLSYANGICTNMSIDIYNISRKYGFNAEGLWEVKDTDTNNNIDSCFLYVVTKPSNITCQNCYACNNTYDLTCSASSISPMALCRFNTQVPKITLNIPNERIVYNYTKIWIGEISIYNPYNCTVNIPISIGTQKGEYDADVLISPNITGYEDVSFLNAMQRIKVPIDNYRQTSFCKDAVVGKPFNLMFEFNLSALSTRTAVTLSVDNTTVVTCKITLNSWKCTLMYDAFAELNHIKGCHTSCNEIQVKLKNITQDGNLKTQGRWRLMYNSTTIYSCIINDLKPISDIDDKETVTKSISSTFNNKKHKNVLISFTIVLHVTLNIF